MSHTFVAHFVELCFRASISRFVCAESFWCFAVKKHIKKVYKKN